MMGDWLMKVLLCEYVVVAMAFAYQGVWPKMLYWVGAATITTAVLWMKG